IAATTGASGLPRKTRSAVAWLRCAALIGDIETCAAASDGASFNPSPTIITLKPWRFRSSMRAILSAGVTPARHSLIPSVWAAARTLGIKEWRAGVTPADKIARIEDLKRQGFKVMMVGDGLNDAPSLAAAHVSMSPISAAHLSQATADLVFLGKPLAPVVAAIDYSRKALHLMRQNLWLAVGYNLLEVPIAISGVVTPLIAIGTAR